MDTAAVHPLAHSGWKARWERRAWRRVLLGCAAASTALYAGMDLLASALYGGYSYTGQTISELSAVGAPTRPLWIPLAAVYGALTIAGGAGIVLAARGRRGVRAAGAMVAMVGVLGLVAWPFAPMHQRDVLAAGGGTFADTLHLVLSGVDTTLFLAAIVAGAGALGRRFRVSSIATLAAVLVAGCLTATASGAVAENGSTPWIGISERVAVFGSMGWIAALAIALLRERDRTGGEGTG